MKRTEGLFAAAFAGVLLVPSVSVAQAIAKGDDKYAETSRPEVKSRKTVFFARRPRP